MSRLRQVLALWLLVLLVAGSEPSSHLTSALNQRAIEIFRQLGSPQQSSSFCPASLWFLLAALEVGSGPPDDATLGRFLKLPSPVQPQLRRWESGLRSGKGFRSSSSFWHALTAPLQGDFQALLDRHQRVDFSQPVRVCASVNQWANQATEGKIPELLVPGDLVGAEALLINAVLLKAKWQHPFDRARTNEGEFWRADGTVVRVPMMFQEGLFRRVSSSEVEGLLLDYSADLGWSYLALKPSTGRSLEQLESQLEWAQLQAWLASAEATQLRCRLPRYRTSSRLDLTTVLKSGPLESYFKPGVNLGKISSGAAGLYISAMFQDVDLEVDESGTTAAAATVAVMTRGIAETISFHRPFLYLLLHPGHKNRFMGRYVGPQR